MPCIERISRMHRMAAAKLSAWQQHPYSYFLLRAGYVLSDDKTICGKLQAHVL
jgi:hypothetical protein